MSQHGTHRYLHFAGTIGPGALGCVLILPAVPSSVIGTWAEIGVHGWIIGIVFIVAAWLCGEIAASLGGMLGYAARVINTKLFAAIRKMSNEQSASLPIDIASSFEELENKEWNNESDSVHVPIIFHCVSDYLIQKKLPYAPMLLQDTKWMVQYKICQNLDDSQYYATTLRLRFIDGIVGVLMFTVALYFVGLTWTNNAAFSWTIICTSLLVLLVLVPSGVGVHKQCKSLAYIVAFDKLVANDSEFLKMISDQMLDNTSKFRNKYNSGKQTQNGLGSDVGVASAI